MLDSKLKVENLMNLVMQFRKVCNHPELFERRTVKSPFLFQTSTYCKDAKAPVLKQIKEVFYNVTSPLIFQLPKLVFDEVILDSGKETVI